MTKTLSRPCSLEPQMGNCVWDYVPKYKMFMCTICGKELAHDTMQIPIDKNKVERLMQLKNAVVRAFNDIARRELK